MNIIKNFCRYLCGMKTIPPADPVPIELREVSHRIANTSTEIQGSATRLKQDKEIMNQAPLAISRAITSDGISDGIIAPPLHSAC